MYMYILASVSATKYVPSEIYKELTMWLLTDSFSLQNPFGVSLGGTLGHAVCTAIAIIGGKIVAQRISVRTGETVLDFAYCSSARPHENIVPTNHSHPCSQPPTIIIPVPQHSLIPRPS